MKLAKLLSNQLVFQVQACRSIRSFQSEELGQSSAERYGDVDTDIFRIHWQRWKNCSPCVSGSATSADCEPREDRMAANSGKLERRFIDLYPDLAENVQLKLFDYARLLQRQAEPAESGGPSSICRRLIALDTEDGYPVMQELGARETLKKEDL